MAEKVESGAGAAGPWFARKTSEGWYIGLKEWGWNIADTAVAEVYSSSESEANARLIAAAPDLLAALRHIEADLEMKHPDIKLPAPAFQRMRAAITKATRAEGQGR